MQEHRPVPWEFIWPSGDFQRLLTHCDTQGAAGSCEGAGLGAYMGGALEGSRLPSASAAGSGMCGQSSVSIQFKPDGGHDWEVYISHLLINTYAPSVESEGLVAEEIHGKHIVNRHPVNQCSPIPGIMTNQIDRVCH